MTDDAQPALFADLPPVEAPPPPFQSIYVHFERIEDIEAFAKLIGFPVSSKTRVLSWPPDELFPDRALSTFTAMKPEEEA